MKRIIFLIFIIGFTHSYSQNEIFDASRKGIVNDVISIYTKYPNSINLTSEEGYTPLILACYHGNEKVVEFLVNRVEDVNQSSPYGSALMAAVVKGNTKIVELLLNSNADVNIADENGTTAMHYAVMFRNYEAVKLLIKANADVKIKDNRGQCALDYAVNYNDKKLTNLLKNI